MNRHQARGAKVRARLRGVDRDRVWVVCTQSKCFELVVSLAGIRLDEAIEIADHVKRIVTRVTKRVVRTDRKGIAR